MENINQLEHIDYRYIRHVRFLKGLSQQDMARYMSISPSVLCRVEGGQIKFTSYDKVRFIVV
ncbi:helix-turn-helix domain-containing protein, partial [Streptomyces californicus]|uniref:helix-turn-helix domain-containing protein n=1 Tax=Streptomyces californicus TaxID=67351 RepID=UPI00364E2E75